MAVIKNGHGLLLLCAAFLLTCFAVGCGEENGNKAVRDAVGKSAGAAGATGDSPYGKVSNETKLPPQGRPPEPGADMSKRGNVARPAP